MRVLTTVAEVTQQELEGCSSLGPMGEPWLPGVRGEGPLPLSSHPICLLRCLSLWVRFYLTLPGDTLKIYFFKCFVQATEMALQVKMLATKPAGLFDTWNSRGRREI